MKDFTEKGIITPTIKEDWLAYDNQEVLPHFPPRLIIGKQMGEEREFLVIDNNPLVRVTI